MTAAKKLNLISVEEYLAGELESPIKHEYVGGVVYAMAGARNRHNLIATNITVATGMALQGRKCRPYNSDTKVHIESPTLECFYYPDASVICESNSLDDTFQDRPVLIFEVLSKSTERIDKGEKKLAYLTIPSLVAYVLVEQKSVGATVFRRCGDAFVPEVYEGRTSVILFAELGIELRLEEVYEGVDVGEEAEEE